MVSTSSLLARFDLLARHHVAGLGIDGFQRDDKVAAPGWQSSRTAATSAVRVARSRARSAAVMGPSGGRPMRRNVSRTRSSGKTFKNGDCSSAMARATFNPPSKTGSPVVLVKSARTMVSCAVRARPPRGKTSDAATATTGRRWRRPRRRSATIATAGRVPRRAAPDESADVARLWRQRRRSEGAAAGMMLASLFLPLPLFCSWICSSDSTAARKGASSPHCSATNRARSPSGRLNASRKRPFARWCDEGMPETRKVYS